MLLSTLRPQLSSDRFPVRGVLDNPVLLRATQDPICVDAVRDDLPPYLHGEFIAPIPILVLFLFGLLLLLLWFGSLSGVCFTLGIARLALARLSLMLRLPLRGSSDGFLLDSLLRDYWRSLVIRRVQGRKVGLELGSAWLEQS